MRQLAAHRRERVTADNHVSIKSRHNSSETMITAILEGGGVVDDRQADTVSRPAEGETRHGAAVAQKEERSPCALSRE